MIEKGARIEPMSGSGRQKRTHGARIRSMIASTRTCLPLESVRFDRFIITADMSRHNAAITNDAPLPPLISADTQASRKAGAMTHAQAKRVLSPCRGPGAEPGIGTGRIIFSLNYTEHDFEVVANRFVAAARAMNGGGWWWVDASPHKPPIKRQILREMIGHLLGGHLRVAASDAGARG
jgi:hypothetical protein